MDKKEIIAFLDTASNIIIALTLFLLPLFFLTSATDAFIIPKQVLIVAATCLLLLIWGVKTLLDCRIVVVATPLNLPLVAFGAVIIVSALLSANRYDSIMQAVPLVAVVVFAFIIMNATRTKNFFSTALSAYILGATASALITTLYFFKFYFLPIQSAQNQFFNPAGSVLQELIYLIPVFIFSLVYIGRKVGFPKIKFDKSLWTDYGFFVQLIALLAVSAGVVVASYQMIFSSNRPILLPYVYGFQTAFASISQDASRFLASLLFGSGYGTFLIDFTRYKLPSFNLEQNIWNLSFAFSSSYFLELIATTGTLGILAFIGIIYSFIKSRSVKNPIFVSVFVAFVLSFILPFSYLSVAGLFVLLGLYVAYLNINGDRSVFDVTLSLVSTKSGLISFDATESGRLTKQSPILPAFIMIIILLVVGFVSFYGFKFAVSDFNFAKSLAAAQANNGQATYELQTAAINDFPYRSDYQRIFSQVNLALANSIASGIKQGSSPSAQVRQNITALLQQSINSGRNAVVLSPRTSLNWQNLGIVYRSLINVGQNADQFAIASINQAIVLDPYNPNLYILLGGIYYQLSQFDQAISQFQVAINLKRDFTNSYYNLGHAYEAKGDLQNAHVAYQTVRGLSLNNKDNLAQIDGEIKTLQEKIGTARTSSPSNIAPATEQTPLSISEPSTVLPTQKPPIKISPPPGEQPATQSAR